MATAAPAPAHALVKESDPADGDQLAAAPGKVTVTFTEEPEISLSSLEVLDATGRRVHSGKTSVASGGVNQLEVSLEASLGEGVYTIAWRVVSRVDGHLTGGTIVFGVGVSPADAPLPDLSTPVTPDPQLLEVGGRWVFLVGLVLLIGTAVVGGGLLSARNSGVDMLQWLGLVLALGGLLGLAEGQRSSIGTDFTTFSSVSVGRAIAWRAIALAVCTAAVVASRLRPNYFKPLVTIAAVAASGSALAHVMAGHAAAAETQTVTRVLLQWVHITAGGVWLGGLAALIAAVRGSASADKASMVGRFSRLAGWMLLVVASAGTIRATNELKSWGELLSTSYGKVVLVKVGLLGALVLLGALNRFRNVKKSGEDLGPLRRTASAELTLAVVVVGAAALLANQIPPASVVERIESTPEVLFASAADFAKTISVEFKATPGVAGPNGFEVRVTDFDSGNPVVVEGIRLLFKFLDEPVGESELQLTRRDPGVFTSSGSQLSLAGRWLVTVLVQRGSESVEIPLEVATRCVVSIIEVEGLPDLYNIATSSGSAQGYTDPGTAGQNEVHITYFDSEGKELPVLDPIMAASHPGDTPSELAARRLSTGHFVADADLTPGPWRFDLSASSYDGDRLRVCFEERIDP